MTQRTPPSQTRSSRTVKQAYRRQKHIATCRWVGLLVAAVSACQAGPETSILARGSADANTPAGTATTAPSQPTAQQAYRLRSLESGTFVDVADGSSTHGSAIVQSSSSDSNSQVWTVMHYAGAFHLVNALSSMCLNVDYQSVDPNAALQQWDCNAGTSEQWQFVAVNNNSYQIVNVNSHQAITSPGQATGTTLIQAPSSAAIAQQWQFIPMIPAADVVSTPAPAPVASGMLGPTTAGPTFALNAVIIYNVFPEIFSPAGDFNGVTAQLSRIRQIGFNTLFVMPVTSVGQPVGGHPAFGSPYCVHDFYAINPNYGTGSDFKRLVDTAHALGMKVVLDEVLNHSAWDNPLITSHPEYYVHTDGNVHNPNSVAVAFTFNDVAQFDYKTPGNGLSEYMTSMLLYWMTTYGVDGFRFDTANNPDGPQRMITQAFWTGLRTSLEQVNPNVIMFGEEENVNLALAPFELDYGWNLQNALRQATTSGNSVPGLQSAWSAQTSAYPAGMSHASLLQDWDFDTDLTMYGGAAQTMDAAVFNATITGVPMIFNGEEVANSNSGVNTHDKIAWSGPQAATFSAFYTSLFGLRAQAPALQQGAMAWLDNSASSQVASYTRSSGANTFLVLINFGGSSTTFTLQGVPSGTWRDVTPVGAPGGQAHAAPTQAVTLQGHDFAVFSLQ